MRAAVFENVKGFAKPTAGEGNVMTFAGTRLGTDGAEVISPIARAIPVRHPIKERVSKVGSTKRRVAPRARASATGVDATMAPSTRRRPSIMTGGKTRGMAQ